MLAIWQLRPATQKRFPLQNGKPRDLLRYLAWCSTDGRKDYAILREILAWDEELKRPINLPQLKGDRWKVAHSLATFLHGITVHRWSLSGMMKSSWARDLAARRFWGGGRIRNNSPAPASWQKRALRKAFGSAIQLAHTVVTDEDAELSDSGLLKTLRLGDFVASDTKSKALQPQPIDLPARLQCSPVPLPQPLMRLIEPIVQLTRKGPTEAEIFQVLTALVTAPSTPRITHKQFGVNLIGYARGELGIGEDIRQVALVLEVQGIPVCILDFAPGKNISQSDETAEHLVSDVPRYGINLFCLTGIETSRYVCEEGLSAFEGRYNIGLWPWELPDWPESCRHAYACVDEVWGISNYTAHAHRFAAPRPVLPMSLPVELGEIGTQTRKDFGLPENTFLFYLAFDINSNAARKNPEGLIKAFQIAFSASRRERVGLVLKVSHPETGCKLWSKIRKIARQDKRIHVIEKTMRKPELLALFKACDCLVSLHRAEGFGRCIAEALLLSKQVIATEFSGNLDFCHEPRVALVRHSMRKVEAKDYMWGEGQMWAEPDLDHAAELMRSIWQEPRELESGSYIFDPQSIGQRYKERLEEIWQQYASKPLAEALEHRTSNIEY
jgi:hypothetical protein